MISFWFVLISAAIVNASKLGSYNIDPNQISVSGLSGGAFMAVQMHVTYSGLFIGAGVIAGGPYWCAMNSLSVAISSCMVSPSLINPNYLEQITRNTAISGYADSVDNLSNDRVYLFSGKNDRTVVQGVLKKAEEYYAEFVNPDNIMTEYSLDCDHGFPTMNNGGDCDKTNNLYINKCGYDAAYQLINHIHSGARVPDYTLKALGQLMDFDQTEFFEGGIFSSYNGLDDDGYVFVPDQCADGRTVCKLHISLHGCLQGKEFIGDSYAKLTGYNEVAAKNNFIILYPQAKKNSLSNPNGCFDWWGYTSSSYASNIGEQMQAIRNMIQRIADV